MANDVVFVTGGSGLVGQFLLAELVRRGTRLRASFRGQRPATLPDNADPQAIEWVEGDILDPVFLQQALTGATTVLHCAAVVSYAPRDAERLWAVNVTGTANVVNACLTAAVPPRLGYVSSVAALGVMPDGSHQVTEAAQWQPEAATTAYAESKYAAEMEVWRGISEGLQAVIVNPSVILGPADPSRSSTQLLRYAAEEHRYYPPGQLNVVDVRDLVAALLALLDRPELLGQRYVLSAGALSYADFFQLAAAAFGARPPQHALPTVLAEVLWRVEAVRSRLTGVTPLLTRETARVGRRRAVFDAGRIQQALALHFRQPPESIQWAASELRRTGRVPAR